MSDGSHIEWTDATWNVATGCTKISDGCLNCYITRTPPFRMGHRRFDQSGIGGSTDVQLHEDRLTHPLRWSSPRKVFVCSLADLFHEDVPDAYLARVFAVMALAPQHTFQLLTKRHARMRSLLSSEAFMSAVDDAAYRMARGDDPDVTGAARREAYRAHAGWMVTWPGTGGRLLPWPLPNVWVGVSAETQTWADIRVPVLLDTPAAVRWVSVEPMLGPIGLHAVGGVDALCPDVDQYPGVRTDPHPGLDWVVCGCESGRLSARPMDLAWAEQILADCRESGVPVLVKQLPTGPRGRATQDMTTFPERLRVREYPAVTR